MSVSSTETNVALVNWARAKTAPHTTATGQVFYSTPVIQDFDEFIVRADYSISSNDRMSYRFNKSWYTQPGIFANNNLLTYADHTPDTSYNTAIQETHIFSPTLLNDFRFGVTREVTSRYPPTGVPNVRDLGVQNVYQTPTKAIESFGVSYGIFNMAWAVGLLAGPALGGFLFERMGFNRVFTVWAPGLALVAIVLARAQFKRLPSKETV